MHNMDLGIYQIIAACCLWELVDENFWGHGSKDECMAKAHADYKKWCKRRKLHYCPPFDRSKLRGATTDCPTFTQHQAKGADMKHLITWLNDVMQRKPAHDHHANVRKLMVSSFASFEKICKEEGPFLSDAATHAIPVLIENALLCFNALSEEALSTKSYMWHVTPKLHMTTHMAYDMATQGRNPRAITCYPDEDMIGRTKIIVEACHGSSYPWQTLRRYAILVGTRWWTHLHILRFG
jgi:hypothetical protein